MDVDAEHSDGGEGFQEESQIEGLYKLSCEQCRQRKVKCDRKNPCTPCTRKHIRCSFPTGIKQRQKRQRSLVTHSYETKIDEISRKLDRLCVAVNDFGASPQHDQAFPSSRRAVSHRPLETPSDGTASSQNTYIPDDVSTPELEGELSFTAHAAYATDYVQQAVVNDNRLSPEMNHSLEALRTIVGKTSIKDSDSKPQMTGPLIFTGDIQMPPMQLAMSCLQKLRDSPRLKFFWSWAFDSIGQFVEYFLTVYSGRPSIIDMIIVNSGLHALLKECAPIEDSESLKDELKRQAEHCRRNLDLLLGRLPFNLPTTLDTVLALYLSVSPTS